MGVAFHQADCLLQQEEHGTPPIMAAAWALSDKVGLLVLQTGQQMQGTLENQLRGEPWLQAVARATPKSNCTLDQVRVSDSLAGEKIWKDAKPGFEMNHQHEHDRMMLGVHLGSRSSAKGDPLSGRKPEDAFVAIDSRIAPHDEQEDVMIFRSGEIGSLP
jgi:hypothetical protein